MRTSARLGLILTAGLALTGCATKTAQMKSPPVVTVASNEEKEPESSRDHWLRRDLEDKGERIFEPANSR